MLSTYSAGNHVEPRLRTPQKTTKRPQTAQCWSPSSSYKSKSPMTTKTPNESGALYMSTSGIHVPVLFPPPPFSRVGHPHASRDHTPFRQGRNRSPTTRKETPAAEIMWSRECFISFLKYPIFQKQFLSRGQLSRGHCISEERMFRVFQEMFVP